MSLQQTPSQTVGPYFIIGLRSGVITDLTHGAPSDAIVVRGRVLDGAGRPVADAVIETWQADAHGRYPQPADPQSGQVDYAFRGFARLPTDQDGRFELRTFKPGRVAGPDGRPQAPHLAVNVLMRGLLKQATTRLYFGDETKANAEDAVLALVPEARRATIVSSLAKPGEHHWEIHMQGELETVFFEF